MTLRLKDNTIDCHRHLNRFLLDFNKHGITYSKVITHLLIRNDIKGIDVSRIGLTRMIIQDLGDFLQYLHEKNEQM